MPPRVHDMGGQPGAGAIERDDHPLADWEVLSEALSQALIAKGVRTKDETRRAGEDLEPDQYLSMSSAERWIASVESVLIAKGVLTKEEIEAKLTEFEQRWGNP
jgi:hypothetical protein